MDSRAAPLRSIRAITAHPGFKYVGGTTAWYKKYHGLVLTVPRLGTDGTGAWYLCAVEDLTPGKARIPGPEFVENRPMPTPFPVLVCGGGLFRWSGNKKWEAPDRGLPLANASPNYFSKEPQESPLPSFLLGSSGDRATATATLTAMEVMPKRKKLTAVK